MKRKITTILAVLLAVAFVFQTAPEGSVRAEEGLQEPSVSEQESEAEIVNEIEDRREANVKHFRMSDGSVMAAVYPEAVHKEENGRYVEIDNTLVEDEDGYKTADGLAEIRFSKKPKSRKMVEIKLEGYTISFGIEKAKNKQVKIKKNENTGKKNEVIKNSSEASYQDVFSGIDLVYDLTGAKLKESIVLKQYSGMNSFTFHYDFGQLKPELLADGSVVLKDGETRVFELAAPFMYDAANAESEAVTVTLTPKGSGYEYTLTASEEWLTSEERVYPVTIDPTTSTFQTESAIYDTYINPQYPDYTRRELRDRLLIGTSNGGGDFGGQTFEQYRTYIWFDMPNIPAGSRVSDAKLTLFCHPDEWKNYQDIEEGISIDLYEIIEQNVAISDLCWNTRTQISVRDEVTDYQCLRLGPAAEGDYYQWNITSLIDHYYEMKNSGNVPADYKPGMMLRFRDENVATNDFYAGFYSGNCNAADQYLRPAIVMFYNDAKGIESYYDYFASSMTGAGSGYVNAFNGNLVYSVPLIEESGSRMPLSISLVYNSANVPIDDLGFGPGWKFSFQQYIEKVEKSDTNAYTYYSYTDADGTEHYFSEYNGKFVDESGSGMVLTDDGTGITISREEEKGKAYFRYISGKAYLEYIENESGDRQTLTYSGTRVTKITDGAGREVTVLYGTDRVTGLQDAAGRTISFYYHGGVLLWQVVYSDGDNIQFSYYPYAQLDYVIAPDGKELVYLYDMFKRVCGIREFDRNKVCAYEYKISYEHKNTTRITDSFHRELLYQFDFYGKTISVTDEDGNAVYSAYSNMNPNEGGSAENNYYLWNKLLVQSQLQKTVVNYIMNNGAEGNLNYWTVESGTAAASEAEKMLGYNSFCVSGGSMSQSFNAKKGRTYTFSAYIKTAGTGSAYLKISAGGTELAVGSAVAGGEWERTSVTFTAEEEQTVKLMLYAEGTAYFDCIQLEDGPVMNRFNLLSNGGFDFGSSGWEGMDLSKHGIITEQVQYQDNFAQEYIVYSQGFESTALPENWQGFTGGYNTWSVTVSSTAAKSGDYSLKMTSRGNSWSSPAYNLYDTFKEKGAGVYRISFWVYADTVADSANVSALIRGTEENSFITAHGSNLYYRASEPVAVTGGTWTQLQCEVQVTEDDLKEDSGNFWLMIDTLPGAEGQNLYIDDFIITASPSMEVKNGDFSDGALLWMGKDGAELSVSSGVLQAEFSGEDAAVTYSANSILKRFGEGSYKLSFRARGLGAGRWTVNAYLMDENGSKVHLHGLGSSSGQWATLNQTLYLSAAQLEQLDAAGRIWLCFGSDDAVLIELDDIIFTPTGEQNKVLRMEGKYMDNVSLYQRVYMNVEDSGSVVIGGWAKADAVPDNEEYNDGRWFGMYAKIHYADSAGATKVVPVEFNTAVRIDDDTTNAPWQYVCGAVPLKSDYKTEINVLYIDLYLCYNKNINYAYFDDIQMFYEEFGEAYSYDEKGNVISSVDAASQKTTFQNTGRDVSSISSPDGTGYEYVYNDKGFLTEYRSSSGVGGKYTYDNYGNPISATVQGAPYHQSIQSGEYYYFNYGSKYLKYYPNYSPNPGMVFGSQASDIRLKITETEEGYYKISSGNMYLEKNEINDTVNFNTHNYGIGQDWKLIPEANGTYRIVSRSVQGSSGEGEQVLTVNNGYVTCTKNGTAKWYLHHYEEEWNGIAYVPVEAVPEARKEYVIRSLYTGSYISGDGENCFMSGKSSAYQIVLEDAGDGYFYILMDPAFDIDFARYLYYQGNSAQVSYGYFRQYDYTKFKFVKLSYGYAIQTYTGDYLITNEYNPVFSTGDTLYTDHGGWILEEQSKRIWTSAQYSNAYNYNYLTKQTDSLRNTVTYAYDFAKGLMTSTTDARGNTTAYTYDSSDRISSVSQGGISVSYSYSNDQLSEITHNGFTYNFIYDAMGRSKKISVGERVLVENMYYAETGLLRKAEYGNGASRSYEYDKQGRVTKLLINGTVRYEYTYNSEGSLTQLKDLLSGVTYRYVYDLLGRLVRVSTSAGFGIRLTYDKYNRTSDVQFSFGDAQLKTTWRYGNSSGTKEKNGVIYGVKYNGVEKLTYTYDLLGRRDSSKINTTNPFVTEYQYKDWNESYTSTLLEKISYSGDRPYIYAYDANGNITSISTESNGTQTLLVSYEYDALNQLVRENHAERNKTIVYTYDNGGNITSVKEYAYTTGAVSGTPITEKAYSYGNTEWKDLLTNYNGTAITYDAIGNPLNWTNGKTFTWTAGRQLSGVTDANNTITYTYDDNGIRTSKTVNGIKTDYYLNGTAIIMQKTGDNCIWYTYDESGNLSGLRAGSSEYYYYRNGQGDIIGIIDGTGSIVAKYSYDAWGTPIAITDGNGNDVSSNAGHIANINPFRYRGYFYDVETGLYYLQSRYYDSQVGRFVNADGYVSTGQGILEHNMFSYCLNNPVNFADPLGNAPFINAIYIGLLLTAGIASNNSICFLRAGLCAGAFASEKVMNSINDAVKSKAESHSFEQMKIDTDGITPGGKEKYGKNHQSQTSILNGVLDAEINHYVVIPGGYSGKARLGDIAVVIDHNTNKHIYAIIADTGPKGAAIGEVSISICWDLGYDSNGRYAPKGNFEIIFFPGTATSWVKDTNALNAQIDKIGERYYP